MPLLQTRDTEVEYLLTGTGRPVTVFAHGLAGAIDETRPFGSGVRGTKVFLHFRGHGRSSAPDTPWTYEAVAAELTAIADHVGASRALGVSLGAGALLRLAVADPARFARLVLVLPGSLDRPRDDGAVRRMHRMADCLENGDTDAVAHLLRAEQPLDVREREDVVAWSYKRAHRLVGTSVTRALRDLAGAQPITDRAALRAVTAPVLVIGQHGDETHPAPVAQDLADALPESRLVQFDAGGVLWSHRRELREVIAGFLNDNASEGSRHAHDGRRG